MLRIAVVALLLRACAAPEARGQSLLAFWPLGGRSSQPAASQQPHPSVVRVIVPERDGTAFGSGTLVDVDGEYGLVVTNWHVVRDAAGPVQVVFPDGYRSAAAVVKCDRDWDLAALAIWKPRVEPVPLAPRAARPGEPLTIAGYGRGQYRAALGRCTQYVAPGTEFPAEMVELSAVARQGDSGGPIFNQQGELAGVLFGAGGGTTAGSYSGRVQQFLASVLAGSGGKAADEISRPHDVAAIEAPPRTPSASSLGVESPRVAAAWQPTDRLAGNIMQHAQEPAAIEPTASTPWRPIAPVPSFTQPGVLPPEAQQPAASSELAWSDLVGNTPLDYLKTALAVLGLMALLMHGSRAAHGDAAPASAKGEKAPAAAKGAKASAAAR